MNKGLLLSYARDVIDMECQNLRSMRNRLGKEFIKALDIICHCKGKVILTGMGKSGIICRKIAGTFSSLGVPSVFLHPADAVHGDLGTVSKDDAVIVISNSGETEEILRILPSIKKIGAVIISLTCSKDSSLGRYSDIVIETGEIKEADVFGMIPSSSTTCALVLGDAMALSLMRIRGVKKQDFAFFHPAGNLGKRLMLKVKDVMHTGREIPSVRKDAKISDVVREITEKDLGFTLVIDKNGRVAGIITDGDIRRLLHNKTDISSVTAEEFMTKNPKTIDGEHLAVEALSMMEKMEITCLVIMGKNRKAMGVVHLHDLLGKKEFKIEY
ncbi:MAG TPA: KpsF/GutQ family sugar-phosphate isomerase [bacterium]|nr:KpsF/GutQ family sugar-phosphate isomerase [bacterium]HPP30044.1 KpsF/GutQ family sugar-phosphate isomerase [bacterium]